MADAGEGAPAQPRAGEDDAASCERVVATTSASGYIHFKDLTSVGARPPSQTSYLLVRAGNTLYGKAALTDTWSTLSGGVSTAAASGTRMAITDGGGNVAAKDGLGGTWSAETGSVDQYIVTPSMLLIRVGGTIYGKAGSADAGTTLVGGGAVDVEAAGDRIAFRDDTGTLWAKDGLGGTWTAETGAVDQYVVTSNLLIIRVGTTLSAKSGLTDMWTTLTNAATEVRAAGNRIAITDTNGDLEVKDGLAGAWFTETGAVDQYAVTPDLLVIRIGDTLLGKAGLGDSWSTLTNAAIDVQAAGTRIAIRDTAGAIEAKDGLDGVWYTETGAADQYIVTSSG